MHNDEECDTSNHGIDDKARLGSGIKVYVIVELNIAGHDSEPTAFAPCSPLSR
jgi:hypothetical protein